MSIGYVVRLDLASGLLVLALELITALTPRPKRRVRVRAPRTPRVITGNGIGPTSTVPTARLALRCRWSLPACTDHSCTEPTPSCSRNTKIRLFAFHICLGCHLRGIARLFVAPRHSLCLFCRAPAVPVPLASGALPQPCSTPCYLQPPATARRPPAGRKRRGRATRL